MMDESEKRIVDWLRDVAAKNDGQGPYGARTGNYIDDHL